ncbi:MAG: hypothetical protein VB009_00435 [Erysipelotrichaceae bacterium]|nr:hypothetical protein [Erysipelotrichaceae bacterium]
MIRKICKLTLVFLLSVCILPFNKVFAYQDQHQNNMESTKISSFDSVKESNPSNIIGNDLGYEYSSTQKGLISVFITVFVSGFVYSVVEELFGLDEIAKIVADLLRDLFGYVPAHTYTYVVDNGCWSFEFPANPFCKIIIQS